MARQVLPIVGAVVGAYFGGPQGAQIGYMIGSVVGNAVDPMVIKGPQIGDSQIQTSAEVFRPIYFGTACGAGNIIMAGPDVPRTFEHDQGKGGGPVQEENRIFKTFAIGIGDGWKGPILGISRIWENEKLVYDTRPGSTMAAESAKFATQFQLYTGTETQMPDDALEAIPEQFGGGVGNVSAFRGLAYIVFRQKDITPWMSIPQYRFEVVTDGSATPPIQMIATRQTESVAEYDWLTAPNGLNFSGTWVSDADLYRRARYLIATPDRYIAYGGNVVPAFIARGESAWSVGTGESTSGVGGGKQGACDDTGQVIVIPGGPVEAGGYLLVSTDKGDTWFKVEGVSLYSCTHLGGAFLGFYGGKMFNSPSGTGGWSLVADVASFFYGSPTATSHASPTLAIFGGSTSDGLQPAIIESYDGYGWELHVFGMLDEDATEIVAVSSRTINYVTEYRVWANNGQMLYKIGDGGTWQLSTGRMSVRPWAATSNNVTFAAIGFNEEGTRTGEIITSDGPDDVTVARTETLDGNESWFAIAALAVTAGQVTSGPIRLDESVERIHVLSGQSLEKVDAADLATRELGGFIVAGEYTGKAAIDMLGSIFMFVSPEYDKKIHHRFRGKAIVRTITDADLVDEPDEGLREDQIEFPKKLHLEAQNTASGYAPAKETSERESSDVRVVGELSVSAPVMFAGDADTQSGEQARTANILHKVAWESARGERDIVVSDQFLADVPGDCYLVNLGERSDRMMIVQQNYADGVLRLRLRYDRASAYVSNRSGNTPSEQTPPPSTIVGATALMVLDLPGLVDAEDTNTALRHIAMGPLTNSWYGAEGQDSPPGSAGYARIARTSRGAVMGTLQAGVDLASEHYTDTTNKVRIQLDLSSYSDRIQALTEQEFLSEGGAFALRNADGEVEILQFMEVDDLGGGLVELSVLLRGRLNTGTFAFPAGSRFVLLSSVIVATIPSALIGQTVPHRAISYGDTTEVATTETVTLQGNSQREWPVAHLLLDRDGDVITATAVPRHRFGTEVMPVQSANHMGYRWTATDGTNTATGDTNSVTPSRPFNVAGWASPITVTVAQLNRITGAGPTVSEDIA